ncbi:MULTISPECIES: hypothetical protein [unclassified Isoptericola]|uniref:hypothetical protein n=1 Tax=unclassified Isoptericola TaxID=2623355 RepID=UPI003655135C
MPARAVVLPATPLLVPGAGGDVDRLGDVRRAVDEALDRLVSGPAATTAGDGTLVVLAPVPRAGHGRVGRLRPSLAGAGVADRWVPAVAGWPDAGATTAHVPASVALVALRAALVRAGREADVADVVVVEVGADGPGADARAALGRARGIVVAGGAVPGTSGAAADPTPDTAADLAPDLGSDLAADLAAERGASAALALAPAVRVALDATAAPGAWAWQVGAVPGGHEHLPASYPVAEGEIVGADRPARA